MQIFTADDAAIMTATGVTVNFGCDILNDQGEVIDDLTPDLVGGTVTHNTFATVHGTCKLEVQRQLDWTHVWLRLWQSVTGYIPGENRMHTARFNLGVFRPAIPQQPVSSQPTFKVRGADKLSLLQRFYRDTVISPQGSSVLAEARAAIGASGVFGQVLTDSTDSDVFLDRDYVWVLDPKGLTSYLRRVNDLLSATAYRGLFVGPNGDFHIDKYRSPSRVQAEWLFDTTDLLRNIVLQDRKATTDSWSGINHWTFIRLNLPYKPAVGDGMYVVDLVGDDLESATVIELDVAGQHSLVEQGDRIVEQDRRRTRILKIKTGPLPVLGHVNVVDYNDPEFGPLVHASARSWTTDLSSGDTDITMDVLDG